MEKTAAEIQKERTKQLEDMADALIARCKTAVLASLNENGSPRPCMLSIAHQNGFKELFFVTSKRSEINGKVTHFERDPRAGVCFSEGGDSVTLIGTVDIISDKAIMDALWNERDRAFFKKGTDDPKYRLLRFRTTEATFWIQGKFRTCKYKLPD